MAPKKAQGGANKDQATEPEVSWRAQPLATGELLEEVKNVLRAEKEFIQCGNSVSDYIDSFDARLVVLAGNEGSIFATMFYANQAREKGVPYIFVPTKKDIEEPLGNADESESFMCCHVSHLDPPDILKALMDKLWILNGAEQATRSGD